MVWHSSGGPKAVACGLSASLAGTVGSGNPWGFWGDSSFCSDEARPAGLRAGDSAPPWSSGVGSEAGSQLRDGSDLPDEAAVRIPEVWGSGSGRVGEQTHIPGGPGASQVRPGPLTWRRLRSPSQDRLGTQVLPRVLGAAPGDSGAHGEVRGLPLAAKPDRGWPAPETGT